MKTKTMSVKNNQMYIGEFKISDLAKTYQTPLYVYDEQHIRHNLTTFKNNFHSAVFKCEVVYASKAFLAPYLCDIIHEYDMSIDTVSMGDLSVLEKAGFPIDKVLMHGNNKSYEELVYGVNNNVGYIVVDNVDELITLDKITKTLKKSVNILIRVNPGIETHTHAYIKTSLLSSKFGESIFDHHKIKQIIDIYNANQYLKLHGFHAHIGSNITNSKSFIGEVKVMVGFMKMVEEKYKFKSTVLNIGGGFGIKYLDDDIDINIPLMLNNITNTVENILMKNKMSIDKLMIEPGRSIVGDAGITVYTVGGIKETFGGKNYVFVDGGMSDNIRPALYQAKYSLDIANRFSQGNQEPKAYDIAGKLCESGDIIAHNIMLGEIQPNDYLITHCTGAYCYSMASNYNGMLKPGVIFVNKSGVKIAITRETLDDLSKTSIISKDKFFDIHTDILYDLYIKPNRFDFHVNQLQNSLIRGGVWTLYSPDDFDLIDACKQVISQIDMRKLPGFEVVLGLEGLRNLQNVEDLEILYNLGFRHAMLTWNEENKYATGAKGDPKRGLTQEGIRVLQKMESLDMIIDLAHLNETSFYEALAVTQKNIIYSHGNVKALCDHVRNVSDEQMQALKSVNGLLGLTLASGFIAKNPEERGLDFFLDHVDYAVKAMGIDLVCFGFDFMDYLSDFPNSNLEEVNNATLVYRISQGLRKRGYSEADIKKLTYYNFYKRYNDKIILWR